MNRAVTGLIVSMALMGWGAGAGAAEETPDATLKLSGGSVSALVGVSWGSGTLTYKGKDYPIKVGGLGVGEVGATSLSASGNVYNLKKLEDFDGNYAAAGAGAAAGGGVGATALKNQNGVRVNLLSTTQGVELAAGVAGVSMEIEK